MGPSCRGKKTAGPAPSGPRRSATQLIATEAEKQQKDVIAAVALQSVYKVQPTLVVSDALSEEGVEKKSESLYVELCSNLDYKVSGWVEHHRVSQHRSHTSVPNTYVP